MYPADYAAAGRTCRGYFKCGYDAAAFFCDLCDGKEQNAACLLGGYGNAARVECQF